MQAVSNTGRSGVLVLKVDEDDVNTVLMNTDIENDGSLKYAYDNFADAFSENILEYAFAYADIPRNQITKKQREAAQSLLKLHEIEKLRYYLEHDVPEEDWEPAFLRWYEKKGVLGEIVLHMFLKEFKNTIPLISKMYFKDSFSQEAKGFDAVHVSQDSLTLWLGETKFYKAWKTKGVVKGGIDELVEDLKKHITKDYLSEQYVIIKRGLETQLEHPQREEWIEKLSRPILLKDVFQYIRIPLLCIYEDDIALDYLKAIDDAVKDAGIVSHTATLRDYYNSINTFPYREQVQTVLILMPIEAKKKLVKCMLEKIWHMSCLPTRGCVPEGGEMKAYNGGVRFQNGDTLIARITPCLENGKAAYINILNDKEVAFGSTEYIVFSSVDTMPSSFYYFLIRSKKFRAFALQYMNGSSGRQRVSGDELAAFPLTKPSQEALSRFDMVAKPVLEQFKVASLEINRLNALQQLIIASISSR